MTHPFKPTHDLYVIPLRELETKLKEWFRDVKKLNISFEFECEASESSSGHMGDLYFCIDEDKMTDEDIEIFNEIFPEDDWTTTQLQFIFQDFFGTKNIRHDVEPFAKKVYIMINK